jgi:hypothetical protein
MGNNGNDEAKCSDFRTKLNECGEIAFRKANTTENYTY